jgi:hypothetical protein
LVLKFGNDLGKAWDTRKSCDPYVDRAVSIKIGAALVTALEYLIQILQICDLRRSCLSCSDFVGSRFQESAKQVDLVDITHGNAVHERTALGEYSNVTLCGKSEESLADRCLAGTEFYGQGIFIDNCVG